MKNHPNPGGFFMSKNTPGSLYKISEQNLKQQKWKRIFKEGL